MTTYWNDLIALKDIQNDLIVQEESKKYTDKDMMNLRMEFYIL